MFVISKKFSMCQPGSKGEGEGERRRKRNSASRRMFPCRAKKNVPLQNSKGVILGCSSLLLLLLLGSSIGYVSRLEDRPEDQRMINQMDPSRMARKFDDRITTKRKSDSCVHEDRSRQREISDTRDEHFLVHRFFSFY